MCGIAGIIDSLTSPEVRAAAVERMCETMAHRGPDDRGLVSVGLATLGMRRLAVFDPAHGHQPIQSPDGRFTLIFNGALINYQSLRGDLAGSWDFRTHCDTEVLLAAFVRWGEPCLERLRGMFAFAVWDARDQSLFLARDPFGIKPLYYRREGPRFSFASEINGLLAGTGPSGIDPIAVADYLSWLAVPAPRTIHRDVFSLRPGERAIFRNGQLGFRRFWSIASIPPGSAPASTREDFSRELRGRLEETVRAHAVADVPVGAFLSGGLDSAVVAALMSRTIGKPLQTFTLGFEEKNYSEADMAAKTARHIGADHHTYILTGAEVARDIEGFVAGCDQPTGDGLNTYYVSRLAHEGHLKVALSGLGGDELFGGYPSFQNLPRLATWLPWWRTLPRSWRQRIISRLRGGDTRKQKLADFLRYARDIHELGSMQRRVYAEPRRRSLLAESIAEDVASRGPFHPELSALRSDLAESDPFEIASAWELRTYMADVLLRDSDSMSMRHSLELRVPFVDRPFIEWLWRQPTAFKNTARNPKDILAAAAADLLPPELRGQQKRGFSLPMDLWMRRELKPFLDETFSDASVGRSGMFASMAVQSQWQGFLACNDIREWSRVWSLAVLIAFVNRKAPPVQPASPTSIALARASGTSPPDPVRLESTKASRAMASRSTLLMTPEIFSSVGGIPHILQLYLKALCDLAAADGRAVRLLSLNDPALDSGDLRRNSNQTLEDWYVCNRRIRRFVRQAWRMSRGCDRVVCGHIGQLPVAWLVKCFRPNLSYYLVAHGIEVWRPFSILEKLALRGAKQVLCVSDFTRREMMKYCRLRPGQAVVLPNALDPIFEIGVGRPLAECPPIIVTVSRLDAADKYKGVEHLIRAMPAIRAAQPGAVLRIIGEGNDQRRLHRIAQQAGLTADEVQFLGYVDHKRLGEELEQCRLFALPSLREGFGIVFLEAMAKGRPCVGARAGGIPEVINEQSGVLVEYGQVPAIAAGCLDALRRTWDQQAIVDHVRKFTFEPFRARLSAVLNPPTLPRP